MKVEILKVTFFSLLFAGCAVGPDYKQPEPAMPDSFGSDVGSADAMKTDWWQSFDDEELTKLVTAAVQNNKDIDVTLARLKEARAGRRETSFDLFPSVNIDASGASTRQSESSFFNIPGIERDRELYNAKFDALWELDFFGRVRRKVESARAREELREAELKDAIVSTISEIARNYFDLRGLQERLVVAKRNSDNQVETVRITEALVKGGQSTELDTARAQSQYKTTLATIPNLEGEIKATIHRLSVLTGAQPTALVEELKDPKPLAALLVLQ